VVCVAVEGGPGTLQTVADAVQKDTPVVIVKVTQHCVVCNVADILLYKNTTNSKKMPNNRCCCLLVVSIFFSKIRST